MHENQTLHTVGIIATALLWCAMAVYASVTDPDKSERRRLRRLHKMTRERRG